MPPLEKQFRVNRDLLAALVGPHPGSRPKSVSISATLALPEQLPLSLPAQLVEHRPDVRIAEAQLHAASAEVGVAMAARWPNLEIDANAGSAALGLTPSFNSLANFWSVAATLTQPIFEGGTLLHRQRAAEAIFDQAAAQYQGAVVGAFQNTADVLHALRTDAEALHAMATSEAAARRSLIIARRQLDLGDMSRLTVLVAEQTESQARLVLLQARANRYSDVVALIPGSRWRVVEPRCICKHDRNLQVVKRSRRGHCASRGSSGTCSANAGRYILVDGNHKATRNSGGRACQRQP